MRCAAGGQEDGGSAGQGRVARGSLEDRPAARGRDGQAGFTDRDIDRERFRGAFRLTSRGQVTARDHARSRRIQIDRITSRI
jgi:hypothetical protein